MIVVELADPEICCGSAGTYNLDQPSIAASLGEKKAKAVIATGAQVVYLETPPNGEPVDCATDDPPGLCDDSTYSVEYSPIRVLHRVEREATSAVPGVTYVSINDILCPDRRCPAARAHLHSQPVGDDRARN